MKTLSSTLTIAALVIGSCSQAQSPADRVLLNAQIYTSNDGQPNAQAIAITADTIVYVGDDAGVQAYIDGNTEVHDMNGARVLPGLHDVHNHILEASSSSWGDCSLDNEETDPENFIPVLQACTLTPNTNGWIIAYGFSIYTLFDAVRPPKEILDDVFPTTPIVIIEETSHAVWVNSAGLAAAGITALTPDPVGGHIVKEGGDPDGILLDNAGDVVLSLALATNSTLEQDNYDGMVSVGFPLLRSNGITSVAEGRTYWKRNYVQTWQQLKADGYLTARTTLDLWAYPNDDDATLIPALQALYDAGDDMMRINQIKLYSDGITINATAALLDPYDDNLGWPFNTGLNYFNGARLETFITALETTGFDFHIHAIGDRGITEALDAIEGARIINGNIGARHRITHLEIVDPLDYPRFAALNVTADMQVAGDWSNPDHWHDNDFLIGPVRADNMIPVRSLFDNGARITLSSDYDVSDINPFVGMQHALTRAPQALPTMQDVVKAYTINGAYVMRQEDRTGSLEVGKYADLIALDQDIFTVPQNTISNTMVTMTMLGGEVIYGQLPLGVNDALAANTAVALLPSITTGTSMLELRGLAQGRYTVEVTDSKGALMTSSSHVHGAGLSRVNLDLSPHAEGLYQVLLRGPSGAMVQALKLVVSR
jgi:predicted amidohydrolase YtcJ